jgi:hypothetical protein
MQEARGGTGMLSMWKTWLKRVPAKWFQKKAVVSEAMRSADEMLMQELRKAHLEWSCAQQRLHHVVEDDEIDYAIFALETAEKRYGMLLKQAKAMKLSGYGVCKSAMNLPTRALEG